MNDYELLYSGYHSEWYTKTSMIDFDKDGNQNDKFGKITDGETIYS